MASEGIPLLKSVGIPEGRAVGAIREEKALINVLHHNLFFFSLLCATTNEERIAKVEAIMNVDLTILYKSLKS
jgi:hypothetical protein